MTGSSARTSSASDQPGPLGPEDVHAWLCRRDVAGDSDRFRRQVLSCYADVEPDQWNFSNGNHGKPRLAHSPVPLDFNISHSGDWLACAVTAGVPVGIDIEFCNPQRDVLKLAQRFFLPHEVADLLACPPPRLAARFYEYWTLKESDIKARGESIGPELEKIGFALRPAESPGLEILRRPAAQTADSACYWLLEPAPDYRLAICCRGEIGVTPRLQVFGGGTDTLLAQGTVPSSAAV